SHFSEVSSGYVVADIKWDDFKDDLSIDESPIDRKNLTAILRQYFDAKGFQVDWSQLESCSDEKLVSTLSMICPFDVAEKQALLEVQDLSGRAELLTTILQMSCHSDSYVENAKH
ncbi:MAG: peptidase S16, partial [Alphaproteobacteria bacterium]|nr:peptidase S16 [Alphaproteobacteria bacterium]